jgi:hypothetical protein
MVRPAEDIRTRQRYQPAGRLVGLGGRLPPAALRATHPWVAEGQSIVRFGIFNGPLADRPGLGEGVGAVEEVRFDSSWLSNHPMVASIDCWSAAAASHASSGPSGYSARTIGGTGSLPPDPAANSFEPRSRRHSSCVSVGRRSAWQSPFRNVARRPLRQPAHHQSCKDPTSRAGRVVGRRGMSLSRSGFTRVPPRDQRGTAVSALLASVRAPAHVSAPASLRIRGVAMFRSPLLGVNPSDQTNSNAHIDDRLAS